MDEEIKDLLKKNLELTEEINKKIERINRFVAWQKIFGLLKILIFVVPIVLGIIYLPPLLKDVIGQYQELLGVGNQVNAIDLNNISPDMIKSFLK